MAGERDEHLEEDESGALKALPAADAAEDSDQHEAGGGIEIKTEDPLTSMASTRESSTGEHQAPALPYPVVGFGASAGGLQAFKEVLENLDPKTGMAFVLVTHLAPDQKSFLSEIVERCTQMPVHSVEAGRQPEPNHLYVLQPDQALTLHDGYFQVEARDPGQLRRSQQSLMDARDFALSVVECVPVPIVVLNPDLSIHTANTAFRTLTQMQAKELDGRSLPDLAAHLWDLQGIGPQLAALLGSESGKSLELEHETVAPRRKTLLIGAQTLSTEGRRVLLLMIEDITLRREAERLIARQKEALESEIETTERNLNRTQDELRDLTGHLFTVQEEERQHLARELHDDVSQRLSLLEMLLQEIRGADRKSDLDKLESARQQLSVLNTDVRQISHRLHPAILNDLGLSAALQSLVKEFGERENMPATYSSQSLPESWPPEAATAIYRIAQEALRNVSKHAGKTHVKVVLSGTANGIELQVRDFGIGFDQDAKLPATGLGMISMQERVRLAGGTLHVHSALGQGTTITVEIPFLPHG